MLRQIVLRDATAGQWLTFSRPVEVLAAHEPGEVLAVVEQAERRVQEDRLFAAGFLSYEAAPGFDRAYVTKPHGGFPLVCLGLFRAPAQASALPPPTGAATSGSPWRFSGSREDYLGKIAFIRRQIAAGNTYQVNYTVRQQASGMEEAWDLFLDTAADAPYAAFIDCDDFVVVSASPELFFELNGERIHCKPMKGTAPRGMTPADDRSLSRRLQGSPKDRAENVMIADMVRNDLGRVARPGSVRAEALCAIEKFRTVWQMTSTVTAATSASVTAIFRALFPSASVTGAPKVASMKLIAALEDSPRQVYTGAIGFLGPERQARFSVAIRTAVIERGSGRGSYGVGGGIVWDSVAADEYQECLDKARVMATAHRVQAFCLLETILWTADDGWFLLQEHLDRMADSAEYFDFPFERSLAMEQLAALAAGFGDGKRRVRLLLHPSGELRSESRRLAQDGANAPLRLATAAKPVDDLDPFLYHKTTRREVYQKALASAGRCDDVLLWNRAGEVTESTIANVVVQIGGRQYTPPVRCGLLAGTFRGKLLREGVIAEKVLSLADVASAEALFLVNSVRGWMPCELEQRDTTARRAAGR